MSLQELSAVGFFSGTSYLDRLSSQSQELSWVDWSLFIYFNIYLISLLSFCLVIIHSSLPFSVYSVAVLDFFVMNRHTIVMGFSEIVAGFRIVFLGYIIGKWRF